ncbi:solute carrier family 12 member 3-like [Pungitius pungitius]|uniref:solute carrier family 12 member 3-like n=1 Tax=Pungitius pungitius TaxID=134920 RepID=UPI002E0FE7C2
MGQLTSKLGGLVPSEPRNGNFQVPPTIVVPDMDSSASERQNSKTQLRRSSVYSTIDLVPQPHHYDIALTNHQIKSRPSLEVLRSSYGGDMAVTDKELGDVSAPDIEQEGSEPQGKQPIRFGWVTGVTIRSMLNIWGVILFIRLTWITSRAGILLTWLILAMSVVVTSVTALSISAIATNGKVVSGGTYFVISRSLGPEIGAPIGLMYSFGNALASALNTMGFSEVVRDLLKDFGIVMVDSANDARIIGVITETVLLCIAIAGMEWESKAQYLFFLALMLSFVNYLVGTVIPPTIEKQAQGIFGYSGDIFVANLTPDWRGTNFFQLFAIFFPACTGILSGVNICGDLKDPATAIPKGTFMAIFWTTLSYVVIPVTAGACMLRDASGNISDMMTGNNTAGCVGLGCAHGWNFTTCTELQNCKYGLSPSSKTMGQLSAYYYIIHAGIYAASLSSALGFLVSGPKIFQCLCRDNIYPYIGFFAKGYGKNDEPLRAYLLCYVIAQILILIGQLNTTAALLSNFFLCSYALINFSCFYASTVNSPGWRPLFRYYSKWTALFGAVISVVLMFLFTWWAALITFSIIFSLLVYVSFNKPTVNWGSSVQASTYNMALSSSVWLSGVEDHVKNFRPQCLVMTGPPNQRPALVDFVGSFTKKTCLMICGDVIMERDKQTRAANDTDMLLKWMNQRKVNSFYSSFPADSVRVGAKHLLQASGLGKLKPNTMVLGFKTNWRESSPESIEDYINTIYDTFDANYCLCILRMMDGLDVSEQLDSEVNQAFEFDESVEDEDQKSPETESAPADALPGEEGVTQDKTVFQSDQGKKSIDIYWIADDGGLTLLVPYLLTRRKRWRRTRIRVFIVGDEQNMEESRKEMITLLNNFRLDCSNVTVITDSERCPTPKNLSRFVDSVAPFRLHGEQQEGDSVSGAKQSTPWKISDKEFEAFRFQSESIVRLNEIIRRNSQHAALVLVSLPVPHRDCSSALYMAWMDTLTCGLHCPVVLIRGNQQNVLTFYCQ